MLTKHQILAKLIKQDHHFQLPRKPESGENIKSQENIKNKKSELAKQGRDDGSFLSGFTHNSTSEKQKT